MCRRVLLSLLLLASCHSIPSPVVDAGPDSAPPDVALPADVGPLPLAVDFTVANCPRLDPSVPSCSGTAPFTVQFVPITTTTVSQYRWRFGDGTPDDPSAAPSHTFSTPGPFDVTLWGFGSTGIVVTKTHAGFIIVLADGIGAPCQTDQQCAPDLSCLCSAANPCTTGPIGGMCTSLCQKSDCPVGAVCTNLATAAANSGHAEPWQSQLCLPSCSSDADCTAGLRCRPLPGWPNGTLWVHGCFADVPADLGGPCSDATGVRRNDLCVTGLCADLGALGLCSRNCTNALCPAGSDCAVFGDGRELCLVACSSSFLCDQDPLLACVAPGPSLLGFELTTPPSTGAGGAYCAPKPCASNTDCGAAGLCRADSGGGHCVARSD
jgi:PKD repeat protein